MQMQANVSIHNRFDVEVVDSRTGKVRQTARGFNIVLDNMWTTLCNGQAFFTQISFGEGTGTLDPTRTSLFNQIASLSATVVETVKALPESYVKKSVTLPMGTYTGKTISEVGVYGSRLNTHALLEDSEGSPITITVGEFDVVTIFATVYSTFDIENSDDMTLISMPDNNTLVNYLTGGSAPTGKFTVGESDDDGHMYMTGCGAPLAGETPNATWTVDVSTKKRSTTSTRLTTSNGNGHVMEVAFTNLFRARLPIENMFEGQHYEGVPVGTGNGAKDTFLLPSKNILQNTVVVKANGVEVTKGTDYSQSEIAQVNHRTLLSERSGSSIPVLSRNGQHMALTLWRNVGTVLDRVGAAWVPRPDVSDLSVEGKQAAISTDGKVAAFVTGSNAPYVYTGHWDTDANAWVERPAPVGGWPAVNTIDVALSANGNVLALAWSADMPAGQTHFRVYDWSGSAWVARAEPAVGVDWAFAIALSADGDTVAITHNASPYFAVYDWSGSAWTKRADPANPVGKWTYRVALSDDGTVIVLGGQTSPYFWSYSWDGVGGAWVQLPQPDVGLSGEALSVDCTADGSVMLAGYSASPYFSVFDVIGGALVKRANPTTLLGQAGTNVSIVGDGSFMAVRSANLTGVYGYDLKTRNTEIRFASAPASGVAITADYTTKGLHKTDQYVVDFAFSIQFGEPAV